MDPKNAVFLFFSQKEVTVHKRGDMTWHDVLCV